MKPTLLMTRTDDASHAFAQALVGMTATAFDIIVSPALELIPFDVARPKKSYDHLVFTSRFAAAQAKRLELTSSLAVYCVGQRTAEAASRLGFEVISADGDSDDLVAYILEQNPVGTVLHVSGEHTSGDVVGRLKAAGVLCDRLIAYTQRALPPSADFLKAVAGTGRIVLPLFSPRSAMILNGLSLRAGIEIVAISQNTADSVVDSGAAKVSISEMPNQESMLHATSQALSAT